LTGVPGQLVDGGDEAAAGRNNDAHLDSLIDIGSEVAFAQSLDARKQNVL
jgi:hypothetical protein